jgi:peptide subunit release factor RF-3
MKVIRNITLLFLILELSIPKGLFHFAAHCVSFFHHFQHQHKDETNFVAFIKNHLHTNNEEQQHNHDDISLNHQHISYYDIPVIFHLKNYKIFYGSFFFTYIEKKSSPYILFYVFKFCQYIWRPPKI